MAQPFCIHNSGIIYSLFSVQIGVLLRPYRNASPMPSRLGEMWHRNVLDVTMKSGCFSLQFFCAFRSTAFCFQHQYFYVLIDYGHTSSHYLVDPFHFYFSQVLYLKLTPTGTAKKFFAFSRWGKGLIAVAIGT